MLVHTTIREDPKSRGNENKIGETESFQAQNILHSNAKKSVQGHSTNN